MTTPGAVRPANAATSPASAGGWSLPVAFGRGLTFAVVVLVLAVGGIATGLLYRQTETNADSQEADLVARVGRVLDTTTHVLVAGFAGSSALPDVDGNVQEARFDSFADGLVSATGSSLSTLAYEPIVADTDRAAFEALIDGPIKQAGAGGLVAASRRDEYLPVRWTHPELASASTIRGFDIASDPVRAAAAAEARDTGRIVFSTPVTSQPNGTVSVFIVQALYRPSSSLETVEQRQGAVVGYLSTAVSGNTILAEVLAQLPTSGRIRITDGGVVLAQTDAPPVGGHRTVVAGSGRQWEVIIQERSANHRTPLMMGIGTVAVASLVGLFLWRNRRQTRELRIAAQGVRLLGRLSEHLAAADTRVDVAEAVAWHAPATTNADRAAIVLAEDAVHLAGGEAGMTGNLADLVAADAWQSGRAIYASDAGDYRRRYSNWSAPRAEERIASAAALPLRRASGELIGVLVLRWQRKQRFPARTTATLGAVAEVCQQSLSRADDQEMRRDTAASLSALGQRLSIARSLEEVASEVVELAPMASGADFVAIGFLNESGTQLHLRRSGDAVLVGSALPQAISIDLPMEPGGPLMEVLRSGESVQLDTPTAIDRFPVLRALVGPTVDRLMILALTNSVGVVVGVIAFVYVDSAGAGAWSEPGRLVTIADLAAQTIERAELYQQQHELVLQLQRRNLPDLPAIAGVAVAARYRPSSSALGLGGDWYDVHQLDDGVIGVVVGDVVGHGIEAIADMTEIRTTMSTLLRSHLDLASLAMQSTTLLAAQAYHDVVFATVILIKADLHRRQLRYVRAGHPPAVLRLPDGEVRMLDRAGTTPIGVPGNLAVEELLELPAGTVLVAYTDGLIERRGENIDVGLARLADSLRAAVPPGDEADVDIVADAVVAGCLGDRETSDDAALVVVRFD